MKRTISALLLASAAIVATVLAADADKKHRVVMEITSDAPEQWQGALNSVENLQKAFGSTGVEIIPCGHHFQLNRLPSHFATASKTELLGADSLFGGWSRHPGSRARTRSQQRKRSGALICR